MNNALLTFCVYTIVVFGLAAVSSRLLKSRSFLSEYFLGSRGLGFWALALTFAATSASGGTFTGYPALIYTHGWTLALWIASYMVFPICTMGLLGKRINQVSRKTGAITVPDILRDRFDSRSFGLLATSLLIFFTCVNLVAQFKAGSVILKTLLTSNDTFQSLAGFLGSSISGVPGLDGADPGYLICLLFFGVAVIVYTTWGGFHAVVWTDVMQGIVMVTGVLIMLPLALSQVGGMKKATLDLASMIPPRQAEIRLQTDLDSCPVGTWLKFDERVFRTAMPIDSDQPGNVVAAIEIIDQADLRRISESRDIQFATGIEIQEVVRSTPAAFPGDERPGSYVTAPGPSPSDANGFLPVSMAFSMFFFWAIAGTGQPGSMVRLMAFRDTKTLRYSIATVAIYFSLIYFPLVIIFCCARLLLPGMEVEADRVMPQMAITLTSNAGVGALAGILVAAPFAAVMSTVDSFLLMVSSSVVRDVYQRNINPDASEQQLKRLSYICTIVVGVGVVIVAINPPQYLQYLIVYVGSGLAACFLAPMSLALYWKRTTSVGAFASMLLGFLSHLSLYIGGWWRGDGFQKPLRPFSLDPVVIGLATAFIVGVVVSLMTRPPEASMVEKFFYTRRKGTLGKPQSGAGNDPV